MSDAGDKHPWWRGAVIYQVYLRSFFDTNRNGIGDLNGIAAKLDYVRNLGVDGIWISPFFNGRGTTSAATCPIITRQVMRL